MYTEDNLRRAFETLGSNPDLGKVSGPHLCISTKNSDLLRHNNKYAVLDTDLGIWHFGMVWHNSLEVFYSHSNSNFTVPIECISWFVPQSQIERVLQLDIKASEVKND